MCVCVCVCVRARALARVRLFVCLFCLFLCVAHILSKIRCLSSDKYVLSCYLTAFFTFLFVQ